LPILTAAVAVLLRALRRRQDRGAWLALGAAVLAGCSQEVSRPPCPPGKVCLVMGNGPDPISLDPQKITGVWEARILSDNFVGLTEDAPDGTPIPGVAERWETSADGLTWTFHLRDSTWSDGVPVTADDFVFSLRRILDPKSAAEYASLLYFIEGAQAVNEGKAPLTALGVRALSPKTLEIRLVHPAPYLLELTKHQTMQPVPRHVVEKWGDAWAQPAHYVSNGPYTIKVSRLGDYVKAVKNPRFYDAAGVCVDEIYYVPTTDAVQAERRVRRGELDMNAAIASNRVAFLRKEIPDYVHTHTYLTVAYLPFNADFPAFRDPRVRRALNMAVDREFIAYKLLRAGQTPAYTFVPPGVANYTPADKPAWASWPLEKRQAEARRLLAEAGYGPGGRKLSFEIKHRGSTEVPLTIAAIQADWRALGVDAKVVQNETQIAYAAFRVRDFDVGDAGWVADYNDAMSFLYLMKADTGAQNYGDYRNAEYDRLLVAADNEPDVARRAAILRQAETLFLADDNVVTTTFGTSRNLVNPKITGWVDNIVDRHPTRYLCVKGAKGR
ncbi:MAG: peptide ABC transporter substrate-binding protein, partial [Phenylobacterium sp.]